MTDDEVILKTSGVTKSFPGVLALDRVDFTLHKGEFHGLMGENGAGKSTFVKILSGVYRKDGGEIWLNGQRFEPKNVLHCSQNGISIIHQETAIVPQLTVAENIFLNELRRFGRLFVRWRKLNADAQKRMDELGIDLEPNLRAGTLPLGRQKIVELIKALSTNPNILIIDEITANLDAEEEELLFKTLRQVIDEKAISVIYISHRMREIFSQCHQLTIFKDGRVVERKNVSSTNMDEVSSLMVGREIKGKGYYRAANEARTVKEEPVLEVKDISRADAYDHISFEVHRGEIIGIGGLADAGHQDIAATLYGMLKPDSGKILINGREAEIGSSADALTHGIGYLPRDRDLEGLILVHPINDNICLPILNKISRIGGTINFKLKKTITDMFFGRLNIRARNSEVPCISLSGGNRQKVVFAKLMASEVNILILNHPTRGVDVGAKQEFYALMQDFTEGGLSIIMISDELPEIIGMSDRIIIMRSGRIAHITEPGEQPQEEQLVRYMLK